MTSVIITHSKNNMYDYIFNKTPTCAVVGDHKILVKFVSKYPVRREHTASS